MADPSIDARSHPSPTPAAHAHTSPPACAPKPAKVKKQAHPRAARVQVPKLTARTTLFRKKGMPWVRIALHFAPKVRLYLTLIERKAPRRHLTLTTDARGAASATAALHAPLPHHTSTVTIRVWGVFSHHRKLTTVHLKLGA